MFKYTFLTLLLFITVGSATHAQTRLIFLRGYEKAVTVLDTNGQKVKVYDSTALVFKHKSYRKRDLFSLANYAGKDWVYYRQDSLFGNTLSTAQMQSYMRGERDANAFYHAPVAFGIGLVFGIGGAIFASGTAAVTPVIAALPSALVEFDIPKINPATIRIHSEEYRSDNAYLAGYIARMHRKRIKNALLGGFSGLAITLPIVLIIAHNAH